MRSGIIFCSSAAALLLLVSLVNLLSANVVQADEGPSHGFNDKIAWFDDLEAGLKEARARNTLAVVLIHKSWCGACKRLRSDFVASESIVQATTPFVMINLADDKEPVGDQWTPDGG